MSLTKKRIMFWLSFMALLAFSCRPLDAIFEGLGALEDLPVEPTRETFADIFEPQEEVASEGPQPTLETSDIEPVTPPVLTSGTCAWVLTADSDGYPSGEIKEGMRVGAGDIQTSLRTYFSHGKSECSEQVFETYHAWYLEEIYYPGKSVKLSVVFAWNNVGTADCASLAMAGGSTALSVGDFQVKAQNSNINIRTDPAGEISDSGMWLVPEGDVGDTLTITQNVSTGIYGKNIRWRYEYVCE